MIFSMTGYAASPLQINNLILQLEIKSVNHRFLDVTIKTAEELKPLENQLRTLIGEKISRGKIDVKIFFKENKDNSSTLAINNQLLNQYLALLNAVNEQLKNSQPASAAQILAVPGMLKQEEYNLEELKSGLFDGFKTLLATFAATQAAEGSKLKAFLITRLDEIAKIVAEAKPLLESIISDYRQKLRQRLLDVLGETEANDNRLQQEFAFFCQKVDVHEELDRLSAHVAEVKDLLTKGGQIGKRLDFICQEMHREANTFGSKSVALETTSRAVDLKVLIEQIREQVQNIM